MPQESKKKEKGKPIMDTEQRQSYNRSRSFGRVLRRPAHRNIRCIAKRAGKPELLRSGTEATLAHIFCAFRRFRFEGSKWIGRSPCDIREAWQGWTVLIRMARFLNLALPPVYNPELQQLSSSSLKQLPKNWGTAHSMPCSLFQQECRWFLVLEVESSEEIETTPMIFPTAERGAWLGLKTR